MACRENQHLSPILGFIVGPGVLVDKTGWQGLSQIARLR